MATKTVSEPVDPALTVRTKGICYSLTGLYERRLSEHRILDGSLNPTTRNEWYLTGVLEAEGYPHQTCFPCHEVQNITGLIRSEMMTLTSPMIAKMRRTMVNLHDSYPVSPSSFLGSAIVFYSAHLNMLPGPNGIHNRSLRSNHPSTQVPSPTTSESPLQSARPLRSLHARNHGLICELAA
jgi:hypothetical protein